MKKIFLMLLTSAAIFTSCSSDEPILNSPVTPETPVTPENPANKEYKVDLTIRSSAFAVNNNPLTKATNAGIENVEDIKYYISKLQIIAYKESGEVAKDTLVSTTGNSGILINSNDPNQNTFSLALTLPAGKYTLAVIGDNAASPFVPNNFNTDYFYKSTDPKNIYVNTNGDTYYENTVITVNPTNDNQAIEIAPITLQPMWSQVHIDVKNVSSAKIPEGTTIMRVIPANSYYGFSLKTKLATQITPWIKPFDGTAAMDFTLIPIENKDSFYAGNCIAKGQNTNFAITFEFLKVTENIGGGNPKYGLISSKTVNIDSKYQIENGYKYNIDADLAKVLGDSFNYPSFGITIDVALIDKNLEF